MLRLLLSETSGRCRWLLTDVGQTEPGKAILQAAVAVAHHALLAQTCTTVPMWNGLTTLGPLKGLSYSVIYIYMDTGSG